MARMKGIRQCRDLKDQLEKFSEFFQIKKEEIQEDDEILKVERKLLQTIIKRDRSASLEEDKDNRKESIGYIQATKNMKKMIQDKDRQIKNMKDRVCVKKFKEMSPKERRKRSINQIQGEIDKSAW